MSEQIIPAPVDRPPDNAVVAALQYHQTTRGNPGEPVQATLMSVLANHLRLYPTLDSLVALSFARSGLRLQLYPPEGRTALGVLRDWMRTLFASRVHVTDFDDDGEIHVELTGELQPDIPVAVRVIVPQVEVQQLDLHPQVSIREEGDEISLPALVEVVDQVEPKVVAA